MDTSVLAEMVLGGSGAAAARRKVARFDSVFSSPLLEAELRAAAAREKVDLPDDVLESMSWVIPARSITTEMKRVLGAGYLRGADLWHLSCALFLFGESGERAFLSLDARQREIAAQLGFAIP